MCLTFSPSSDMLSTSTPSILPATIQATHNNPNKQRVRRATSTEIRGLLSLVVAALSNAVLTSVDQSSVLLLLDQVKSMFIYVTVAIPAIVMARKVLFRRRSLHKLTSAVSLNTLRLSNKARASSAATLSKLWKTSSSKASLTRSRKTCIMSASEPFVSRDVISKMTLLDVTTAFRYARQGNRPDFARDDDDATLSPLVREVLEKLDRAAVESRGSSARVLLPAHGEGGTADAILFCGAMRLFAEWRIVRQVPDGYKGYAAGMNLGRRDLIQNIGKMEAAAQDWIELEGFTPSLSQLLQHEVFTNKHSSLPKLQDGTAAIGLLWVKRQLHYQACIYTNLVAGQESQNAVRAAYKQVFDPYHGWFVQQMFQQSFRAAPPAVEIYKFMNPNHHVLEQPFLLDSSCSSFDESSSLSGEDDYYVDDQQVHANTECNMFGSDLWDKAGRHIRGEFGKFVQFLAGGGAQRLTTQAMKQHDSRGELLGMDRRAAFAACRPQEYAEREAIKTAHEQIQVFLDTVQPVLDELSSLLDKLNMNDPTKV